MPDEPAPQEHRSPGLTALGGLGGGIGLGLVAMLVVVLMPVSGVWRFIAAPLIVIALLAGIVLGASVGGRSQRMSRNARVWLAALLAGVLGAAIGGSLWLTVTVSSQDFPHGLAAFVKGGLVGLAAGLALGAWVGSVKMQRA